MSPRKMNTSKLHPNRVVDFIPEAAPRGRKSIWLQRLSYIEDVAPKIAVYDYPSMSAANNTGTTLKRNLDLLKRKNNFIIKIRKNTDDTASVYVQYKVPTDHF